MAGPDRFAYQYPDATPAARRDGSVRSDAGRQIQRIGMEVLEACEAWDEGNVEEAILELMDVQQATETALRMIGASARRLSAAKAQTVVKNMARGYYR